MADAPDYYGDAMKSNDQMIGALQQANANYKPQGIFANVDPTMLSLAQGLLAPTKTGGFGESISNAAGAVAGPLAQMKQAQMTNLEKIATLKNAQARLAMEAPYYQARGDYYGARADATGTDGVMTPLDIKREEGVIADYQNQLKHEMGKDNPDPMAIDRFQQLITYHQNRVGQAAGVTARPPTATPITAPAPDQSSPGVFDTISKWWNGTPSTSAPSETPSQPAGTPSQPAMPQQNKQQQPNATDQSSTLTVGSTKQVKVGKDNLTATYAPDGKWYVVKDGKHYPVVE